MVPESWNPDIGTLEWFAHCAQLAIDKIFFGGSNSFVEIEIAQDRSLTPHRVSLDFGGRGKGFVLIHPRDTLEKTGRAFDAQMIQHVSAIVSAVMLRIEYREQPYGRKRQL